jgi:Opy2 protein
MSLHTILFLLFSTTATILLLAPAAHCLTTPVAGCVFCIQRVPQCSPPCHTENEICHITPQSCLACATATCIPTHNVTLTTLFPAIPATADVNPAFMHSRIHAVPSLSNSTPPLHSDDEDDCLFCPMMIPECKCNKHDACLILPRSCHQCAKAICESPQTHPTPAASISSPKPIIYRTTRDMMKENSHQGDSVACLASIKVTPSKTIALQSRANSEKQEDFKDLVSSSCVQCLWNPTCDKKTCPKGTKCHYKPPTCDRCAEANCIPI